MPRRPTAAATCTPDAPAAGDGPPPPLPAPPAPVAAPARSPQRQALADAIGRRAELAEKIAVLSSAVDRLDRTVPDWEQRAATAADALSEAQARAVRIIRWHA